MELEEIFCKLYPEYSVNGKPLSPYFDLFESGYEQAENRIEELEAELKAIDEAGEHARKQITESFRNKKPYWELEKENAELKCECRRCVYSDCPCILSDYGKDKNGICAHFKDVFDEIVELQHKVDILQGFLDRDIEFDNLQKEG